MADTFTSSLEKLSYALGLSMASNIIGAGIKEVDSNKVLEALNDALNGAELKLGAEEANATIQAFLNEKHAEAAQTALVEGEAFLKENATKEGVEIMDSGIQYIVLNKGEGAKPTLESQVKCHYHGTLIDGSVFDSSVERNDPATFPLNGVIQGWQIALQEMQVGEKRRLFIPSSLAYGEQGAGGAIGPNQTLIFEVELLEIL
ncbi:FKBP-type peptidyl-prolyl cis-trans isomerase [Halosquirtibacter xylanolyticus]|uniref:FKBP-type peptidyl-prolyl cis-trans isomerase n=1 Tax=Halosquirtibacter xylanolyticus TaxID=3374599 RepID=UPI003747AF1D|nr:FKBP-type peptidyl-prolyl cis-trans isomerase [Prolixibacteraceae bacterium]